MCRSPQMFSPRSAQKQSENMRFPQTFKKGGADPRKQTLSGWVGKLKTHTKYKNHIRTVQLPRQDLMTNRFIL